MIDNSRIDELRDNFDINKCDLIILAELKENIANLMDESVSSDELDESDGTDEFYDYSENINKYLIIDGQHRITMITQLSNSDPIMEEYILLDIRQCKTEREFKNYIDSTNNRKIFHQIN